MPIIDTTGIRPIERQQPTEGMERVRRRDDGGGFRPQTNVNLKAAIKDIAATLGKIVAEEKTGLQRLPKEIGDVVKNILQQALSVESTLGKGVGSTIESQRFSMEQLVLFARMLSQMGTLSERGYSMRLSEETQALMTQFKAALVSQSGGEVLEPVLLMKSAFELVDAKTAEELPPALYEILSHLAQVSMGTQQQQAQPQSESMQFLKQLIKFFMPRPGVDIPTEKQLKQQHQQGQRGQSPTSSRFLDSMFRTFGGRAQAQGSPQGQQATFNQPTNAQGQQATFNQPTNAQGQQATFNQPTTAQGQQATFNQPTTAQGQTTFNQPTNAQGQTTFNQPTNAQGQPTTFNQPTNAQGQPTTFNQPTNAQGQPTTFNQPTNAQGQPTFNQPTNAQGQTTFNQPTNAQGQTTTFNQPTNAQGQTTFNQPTNAQGQQTTFNQPTTPQGQQATFNQPTNAQGQQTTFNQPTTPQGQQATFNQPTNAQGQQATFNQLTNAQGQQATFNQPTNTQGQATTFNQPTNAQGQQTTFNQPTNAQGQQATTFNQPTNAQGQQATFNQPTAQGQQTTFNQPTNAQGQQATTFNQPTTPQGQQTTFNQPTTPQGQQTTFNQPTNAQGQQATFNQPTNAQGQTTFNQPTNAQGQPTTFNQPTNAQGQTTFNQPTNAQGQPTTFNQPTNAQGQQATFNQPTTPQGQQATFNQPTAQGQATTTQFNQQGTQAASTTPELAQQEPLSKDFIARQRHMRAEMAFAKDSMIKQNLQNTPQTADAMKGLAQFLLRGMQMTPRDTALLQNFINNTPQTMNETEARHLQNLLRLCQQNVPLTVQQAAVQQKLPDLPRLWAFMQMCDLAMVASRITPKAYKRASKDISDFANAMRRAMTAENSVVQDKRSFQMLMPIYMGEEKTTYPTYLSIYDEKERDEETGEDKKETWLRICVLTEYIGAAELVFRVYDETKLDLRFYFSRQDVAEEFRSIYLDDLQNSINKTALNIGEVRVGGGSERMFSF